MARIALTGASGFVGGTVAAVLCNSGHEVTCLVRRSPGARFHWPVTVVATDDTTALERAMVGHDAVLHLAIYSDILGMYSERQAAYDGCVGLTQRITNAANRVGAQVGYLSSDWVFDGTGHLVPEEYPPNPVNMYGFLKAASELVVLNRAESGFIARVGGVQGVHQTQVEGASSQGAGFGSLVRALVETLQAGRRFTLWEADSINCVATPIVAAEIGALLGRAVERQAEGVLHFAGGTAVSRRELAIATCKAFDLDIERVEFGSPPEGAKFPGPIPRDTSIDGARTMALLGTLAHPIEAQLAALREELESGRPTPIT